MLRSPDLQSITKRNTLKWSTISKISLRPMLRLSISSEMSYQALERTMLLKKEKRWTNKRQTIRSLSHSTKQMLKLLDLRSEKSITIRSWDLLAKFKKGLPSLTELQKKLSGNMKSVSNSSSISRESAKSCLMNSIDLYMRFIRRQVSGTWFLKRSMRPFKSP